MHMTLTPVAIGENPLSLADVKNHLRVTDDSDDTYISSLMAVALGKIDGRDGYLGRALLTQEWDCYLDYHFPPDVRPIEIPLCPLQSVSFIKHTDLDGVQRTIDQSVYTVDTVSSRARIVPAYSQCWPSCRDVVNAVQIRGIFGYGDTSAAVPAPIKHAMLLMVGHLYANREETVPTNISYLPCGVDHLLAPFRVRRF